MNAIFRFAQAGIILLAMLAASPAMARPERQAATTDQVSHEASLENLLNPDGTLNLEAGFNGSVDASGWQMTTDARGMPRFTRLEQPPLSPEGPDAAGDEWWDDEFMLGTDDSVYAIAVSGSKVYMGGDFDHAGGVAAQNVACWDSAAHTWSALGGGVNSRVLAIAASGNDVYVGGNFTQAGGSTIKYIAHWDANTNSWSAMGSAMTMTTISPEAAAIAVAANGDVYVGGQFETIGGVNARNIARWDGSAWHALGVGVYDSSTPELSSKVNAIAINGDDVYVGGQFLYAGGYGAHSIARWNGSAWSTLGSGVGGSYDTVDAVAVSGSNVYIAGEFDTVTDSTNGAQNAGHVAMWNGSEWSTMAGGVDDPDAYAIAIGSDGVYVGGRFSYLADGTTSVSRVARWNGASWSTVGASLIALSGGVDSNVYALAYSSADNSIYLGGHPEIAGGRQANHVARYSATDDEWYALGNSVNFPVYALAVDGNDIYLGGSFNSAGGLPAHGIAVWNKSTHTWSSLGSGLSGCSGLICVPAVYAISISGGYVYAGGNFTSAGGISAKNIARWDLNSHSWSPLGDGVFGCTGMLCTTYVRSICPSAEYGILVGGRFDYAGSSLNQANNIAPWDGSGWGVLGNGTNGTVYAIANPSSNTVYIGGAFTTPETYLAKWNGATWSSLNADVINGAVYAIEPSGFYLYIGGAFTNLGGPNGDHISVFYTNDWHQLDGDGLDDTVYALKKYNIPSSLLAGGDFTSSGILGLNRFGNFFTGYPGSWSGYGSGADATVRAVAYDGRYAYIGGSFLNAGNKPSAYFGRWGIEYDVYLPVVKR